MSKFDQQSPKANVPKKCKFKPPKNQLHFGSPEAKKSILINDENIFLDIIRQVQLPAVQVMVRMRSKEEALQGKTFQELSLTQHHSQPQDIAPDCD